jgi:type IV pilus assembly protein PilA
MFRSIQKAMKGEKGFTLIELLVVVAIIGILVAIAIPQFASYKKNANDAASQTDVRTAALAAEAYYASNNAYPAGPYTYGPGPATILSTDPLGSAGFGKVSTGSNVVFTNNGGTPQTFNIKGWNTAGTANKTYTWDSRSGGMQ